MGSVNGTPLCHANLDGTKSDPDCYAVEQGTFSTVSRKPLLQ